MKTETDIYDYINIKIETEILIILIYRLKQT